VNELNEVVKHFCTAALFTEVDELDNPLGDNYSVESIAPESMRCITANIAQWLVDNKALTDQLTDTFGANLIGYNLWLTSQGHGVGFGDRDLDELGDQLTRVCEYRHDLFSNGLYVGDDGQLYFSGCEAIKEQQ